MHLLTVDAALSLQREYCPAPPTSSSAQPPSNTIIHISSIHNPTSSIKINRSYIEDDFRVPHRSSQSASQARWTATHCQASVQALLRSLRNPRRPPHRYNEPFGRFERSGRCFQSNNASDTKLDTARTSSKSSPIAAPCRLFGIARHPSNPALFNFTLGPISRGRCLNCLRRSSHCNGPC